MNKTMYTNHVPVNAVNGCRAAGDVHVDIDKPPFGDIREIGVSCGNPN